TSPMLWHHPPMYVTPPKNSPPHHCRNVCVCVCVCVCVWVCLFTHPVCKSYFPSSFPGKGIGKALMSSVAKVSSLLVTSTILIQSLNCHFNGDSRRPIY